MYSLEITPKKTLVYQLVKDRLKRGALGKVLLSGCTLNVCLQIIREN